jgi:hypothetical protein
MSEVMRVEFVGGRMPYIILTDHWYGIVLNIHIPMEEKIYGIRTYIS